MPPLKTEVIESAVAEALKKGHPVIRIFSNCSGQDGIGTFSKGFLELVCTIRTNNPEPGIEEYQSLRK